MEGVSLRERLKKGEILVGPWVVSTSPAFAEIPGPLGFDFVYFDREHTTNTWETIERMVVSAKSVGTPAIIRIEDDDPINIRKTFEIGAQGILVPHVMFKDQTEAIVKAAKFPPVGTRGVDTTVRSARDRGVRSAEDYAKYMEQSNRETLVCALIEDKEGIENIDEIVSVEGLDVVCFGAGDYSASVGVPGQGFKAEAVRDAFDKMIAEAKKTGVAVWFSPSPSLEGAKELKAKGVQVMMIGNDQRAFYVYMRDVMEKIVKKIR